MTNYDEEYWKTRPFEDKYFQQTLIFIDFCEPKKVVDIGCGKGFFVHAFNYYKVPAIGYDISKFAIEHPYELAAGKTFLLEANTKMETGDLVICYDVLEHVPEPELDAFIDRVIGACEKTLIFSICMAGDPNFEKDKSHALKRTQAWWIIYLERKGLTLVRTPDDFMFRDQILIFQKEGEHGRK